MTTDGHLLGGRVLYRQPATGFRSGLEPVLLAASVPARTGEHVLEVGTGAGAALLCLSHRVHGLRTTGVELHPALSAIATDNARRNGFADMEVVTGDIASIPLPHAFDHAIANPPYHPPGGSASPEASRDLAKRGSESLIDAWIGRMSAVLRHKGSLTLIVPAWLIPCCLTAMAASRSPCSAIFPLWPKAGRPAKLNLLRGVKDGRGPMRLLPGLVLHQPDGSFTEPAAAILTEAAALALDVQLPGSDRFKPNPPSTGYVG